MTANELAEHARYLNDGPKLDAYRRALAAVLPAEATVLDLGCGTGLLGLLACEAGARRVVAVDSGPIINLAREIAAAAGYADRIEFIETSSTLLTLDEQVDVVVADQLGGLAFEPGVLEFYADARRLLKPGGAFIPSGFDLRVAACDAGAHYRHFVESWGVAESGLADAYSVAARYAVATPSNVRLDADDLLSASHVFATIRSDAFEPFGGTVDLEIVREGTVNGLVGCFTAHMAPNVTMTNDPSNPDRMRHRWQTFLPLAQPVNVASGDRIVTSVRVVPDMPLVTWNVDVVRDAAVIRRERHSSFDGQLLSLKALAAQNPARTVATDRADAIARAIELVRAGITIRELAEHLRNDGELGLTTPTAAMRLARRLAAVLEG